MGILHLIPYYTQSLNYCIKSLHYNYTSAQSSHDARNYASNLGDKNKTPSSIERITCTRMNWKVLMPNLLSWNDASINSGESVNHYLYCPNFLPEIEARTVITADLYRNIIIRSSGNMSEQQCALSYIWSTALFNPHSQFCLYPSKT